MERKQNTNGESQWGISSAGRAPALHAGGQEFESPILHHLKQLEQLKSEPKGSFLMHKLLSVSKLYKSSNFN